MTDQAEPATDAFVNEWRDLDEGGVITMDTDNILALIDRIDAEVAAREHWDLISELSQQEGESVTIVHPNPSFDGPSFAITYAYGFDDCECENFYGESYKECLQKAKEFRDRRNA